MLDHLTVMLDGDDVQTKPGPQIQFKDRFLNEGIRNGQLGDIQFFTQLDEIQDPGVGKPGCQANCHITFGINDLCTEAF